MDNKQQILNKLGLQERSSFNILKDNNLCDRILKENPIWIDDFVEKYDVAKSFLRRLINEKVITSFSNIKGKGSKIFIFEQEALQQFNLNINYGTHEYFTNLNTFIELYLLKSKSYLTTREYDVVNDILINKMTFDEVGKRYDLTDERIKQIFNKSVRRLKYHHNIEKNIEELTNNYDALKSEYNILKVKTDFLYDKLKRKHETLKNNNINEREERRLKILMTIDNNILNKKLVDCDLSARALNCFDALDVNTILDVISLTDVDLLSVRNFGKKTLKEINYFLKDYCLKVGMLI